MEALFAYRNPSTETMKTASSNALFLAGFDQRLNEDKANALYVEYKRKVYRLALSYVKDTYLAEDLTHDILVKCYVNRKKFNGDCSFHSWMHRVAANHCIDFLRKSYRHRDFPLEEIELRGNEDGWTPESEVILNYDQEELRCKLNQLPSKYAEVIILYYYKERSLKEIEEHLNIKLSTVKTRLYRAIRLLRKMYKSPA